MSLLAVLTPGTARAQDPAPLPGPDALQQPLDDGCQRNPVGLLTFTSPEWVYVYAHESFNPDPSRARVVEGQVSHSETATGDLPQNHAYYDFSTDVIPGPGYQYLLGGDPVAHNGNYADTPWVVHMEWETGVQPAWARATTGDSVKAWGSWVWDCGHWGDGFTADPNDPSGSAIKDLDYFLPGTNQNAGLRGEQTEFHPIAASVVIRDRPSRPEVRETQADVMISSQGTTAHSEGVCSLAHPPDSPNSYPPAWTACINDAANAAQPVNDRNYTFFIPAPPRPAPGVPLRVRVVDHGVPGAAPVEQIVPRNDGAEVTIPFKGFGSPGEALGYGKTFYVGWDGPTQDRPAHYRIHLHSVKINNSLDDPEFGSSLGVPPGEWGLYADLNGEWSYLDDFAPALNAVFTGDTVPINHSFDVYVPRGDPLRFGIDGRECDLPRILPCPATSEVADDNDSPQPASVTYADPASAVGDHTLIPSLDRWELSYSVEQVSPASKGPPVGPGCFDVYAPSTRLRLDDSRLSRRRVALRGGASDGDCSVVNGAPLRGVQVAVSRRLTGGGCRHLRPGGRLSRPLPCTATRFLPAQGHSSATGLSSWVLFVPGGLRQGKYSVVSRAIDRSGNIEKALDDASSGRFRIGKPHRKL